MNGDQIPGLLDALGEWVRQNRDPNTGRVFGATVRDPVEGHNVKTYAFICDDEDKPYHVFVWQFGNVFVERADFTKNLNLPDSEIIYNENFEFEEAVQVVAKVDHFLRESAFLVTNGSVAASATP